MPTLYNGGGVYQGIQTVITVTSTAAVPTTRGDSNSRASGYQSTQNNVKNSRRRRVAGEGRRRRKRRRRRRRRKYVNIDVDS